MSNNKGFTIVELMIATAVFSIVLLLCAFALLQIGRTYYKGITAAKTQEASRTITDEISRGIQFSGNNITTTPPSGNSFVFCVGDQRYSVKLDQQVEPNNPNTSAHQGYHALVVDTFPGCTASTPSQNLDSASVNGRELVPQHMRLAKLSVSAVPGHTNLYDIDIRVVYGDDDLLNASRDACSGQGAGTQFCAVSELNTYAQKRI